MSAWCLLYVCLVFASCRLCFMHASYLFDVCSMFAWSSKWGIHRKLRVYSFALFAVYKDAYKNKKKLKSDCAAFARHQNVSPVLAMAWSSVCLSGTVLYCVKTMQARITKFVLSTASKTLVYRDKISCHWVQGIPSNEGVKEGYPLKRRHFAVIGSNNVKTVADRYRHAAYHNKHWRQTF